MVQLLCSQHEELIRVQLAECFFVIARNDFPAQWPTALDEAVHALTNAPNPQSLYGALLAYNQLCKVYRTALNDKDAVVLEEICNKGMSIVLNLLQETTKQKTPEAYAFAHLAIKTVNYCLYIRVPAFFKPIATMDSLMQMLLSIAAAEIPAELVHTLYEQRQLKMYEESVFKHKKWALRIVTRIIGQNIKPRGSAAAIKAQKQWNKDTFARYSVPATTLVMSLVASAKNNVLAMPHYLWYQCFRIISYGIPNKTLYTTLIKPQMPALIGDAILNALKLAPYDLDTWREDPHAFVAQSLNVLVLSQDYRSQAETTLKELIKTRTKTALPVTMKVIEQVLNTYAQGMASSPSDATKMELAILKDACLRMVGVLRKFLSTKDFAGAVEQLLAAHAIPELLSYGQPGALNPPVLAVRALWVITEYAKLNFTNASILQTTVEFSCAALSAPDLTLRVEAGQALGKLLAVPSILEYLRPRVKMLFERVFSLMDEFDSETLGVLFRKMLEYFEDDLAPIAQEIIAHIVPKFMSLMRESDTEGLEDVDEEAEEKFFTAQQYLASIHTVLVALENAPERIPALEAHIVPVIHAVLDSQLVDFVDDAMIIVQALTYYPETVISDAVWSIYPKIIKMVVEGWGTDCLESAVNPLANYISKNLNQFLAGSVDGQKYFDMLISIPVALFADRDGENMAQLAAQLLRVLTGYAGEGQLVPLYTPILKLCGETIAVASNTHLKILIFDSVAALMYYNPLLTIQCLNELNLLTSTFNNWFALLPQYKSTISLYYAIIGLSALLKDVGADQLPAQMAQQLPVFVGKLCEAMLRLQELENEKDVEDEDDDEEVFQNIDSDVEDDDDDGDEEALESKLAALSDDARRSLVGNDVFEDDFQASEDGIVTPLDDMNSFAVFLDGIQAWVNRDGGRFPEFTASITNPASPLAPVFEYAKVRRQEFDDAVKDLEKEDN